MQKKGIIPYLLLILVIGIVLGGFIGHYFLKESAEYYQPPLEVSGDVNQPYHLTTLETFPLEDFTYRDDSFTGISLTNVIQHAQPLTDEYLIYLTGSDGLTAAISGENLTGAYLTFSDKYGWEGIHLNHPVSSNIKEIVQISVVSKEALWDLGLNVITAEENLANLTPGQLHAGTYTSYLKFEGESQLRQDDTTYETRIFTRRRGRQLEDLIPVDYSDAKVLVIGGKGENQYHQQGFLEVNGNQFNYLIPGRKGKIEDVQGVMLNPPPGSICDTYYDSEYYLESGQQVMVVLLDGFGYHQYQYAIEHGYAPFLSTLAEAKPALSVYQPVTNAGMAAILTGVLPSENGVYSRKQKDLLVPDLFNLLEDPEREGALLEGDIKILNTSIEPVLHLDTNGNGTKDDEIFQTALKRASDNLRLLFVHFHSIDDRGHTYGDLAEETMDTISTVDGYLAQLFAGWSGKIILVADHGMHSNTDGGGHGTMRYQDLIVPYLMTEGEIKGE